MSNISSPIGTDAPRARGTIQSQPHNRFLSVTGFVTLTVLIAIVAAGALLSWFVPGNPVRIDPALAQQFLTIDPSALRPEPGERLIYFGLLFCTPFLLTAAIAGQRAFFPHGAAGFGDILLWGILLALCLVVRPWAVEPFATIVDQAFASSRWWIVGAVIVVAVGALLDVTRPSWRSWIRISVTVMMFLLAATITFSWLVFGAGAVSGSSAFAAHWDPVFYSIVQIYQGGVCLADVQPQYGCYGEFLRPLFAIIGLSVTKATITLATLQASALMAAFWFAFRLIASPLAAGAACLWVLLAANRIIYLAPDHFFQYMPLRFTFPAFSLLLLRPWQVSPSGLRAGLSGAFSGLAVFWNVDSGVVVLVALGLFVSVSGARSLSGLWSRLSFLLWYGAGALVTILCVLTYLSLRAGSLIDPAQLVSYQKLFFFSGFYMLPMPPAPDYWTIAVAIMAATLAVWLVTLGDALPSRKIERAAFLAILGSGLFGYFVGRSHPQVFILAAWPSVILVFFLVDRGEQYLSATHGKMIAALCRCAAPLALVFGMAVIAGCYDIISNVAQRQWGSVLGISEDPAVRQDAAFIARHTPGDEAVGLLADNQASLLAESGRRSAAAGPGVAETILRRDAERTIAFFLERGPTHLFVAQSMLATRSQTFVFEPWVRDSYPALLEAYEVVQAGPDGRLLHLVRKRGPPVATRP